MNTEAVRELKQLYFSIYGREGTCEYRIEHPAFSKWKITRDYSKRLKTILDIVGDVQGMRVFDAGCAEGAFCHHLAMRKARVIGVDYCAWRIDLAKSISNLYRLSPKNPYFKAMTFERFLQWRGAGQFDFILFLSVFHHCLRRGLESTWQKMQLVSEHTGVMFLEADVHAVHCHLLMKKLGCKQGQLRQVIPQFIVDHSGFTSFEELPTSRKQYRPFFVFRKGK